MVHEELEATVARAGRRRRPARSAARRPGPRARGHVPLEGVDPVLEPAQPLRRVVGRERVGGVGGDAVGPGGHELQPTASASRAWNRAFGERWFFPARARLRPPWSIPVALHAEGGPGLEAILDQVREQSR